jgi:guanylate kinase
VSQNPVHSLETVRLLGEKTLVLLVAPSAAGKSTVMNRLVKTDGRFVRVSGFTSRIPREDDETDLYRYIAHDAGGLQDLLEESLKGDVVQCARHLGTGFFYGTSIHDYGGEYNCKDVLSGYVDGFRALPVKNTHTFSLVCDPNHWIGRLVERYDDVTDPDLQYRLAEAEESLEWSLNDSQTIFIRNNDGEATQAAQSVTAYATEAKRPIKGEQNQLREVARAMAHETHRLTIPDWTKVVR